MPDNTRSDPDKQVATKIDGATAHESADTVTEQARELRVAWRESPEYQRVLRFRWITLALVIATVVAEWPIYLAIASARASHYTPSLENQYLSALLTLVCATSIGLHINLFWSRVKYREFIDRRSVEEARQQLSKAEHVADAGNAVSELDLTSVWQVTQKRLDYYHKIATAQAEQSFRYSQLATVGGFSILVVSTLAVIVTAFSGSTAGAVSSGIIGVVGAGFSGFLSKTFLRTQETSKEQLRSYFAQPLVFSQHLAAERLLSLLDGEQKAASVQELIRTMSTAVEAQQTESQASEIKAK